MTFLTNSLYGQKRPFRKEHDTFSYKTALSSPKSISKIINCESPENPEIEQFIQENDLKITKKDSKRGSTPTNKRITEISSESRDLVIAKKERKENSIQDENSIKQVYESLGKRLEQENTFKETKIKNLLDLLELSKSELSNVNLDFTNFKSKAALEKSTDSRVLQSFVKNLQEFSELQFFQVYVKEMEEFSKKMNRNEFLMLKLQKKFKEITQKKSRITKELKKTAEKLEISDRTGRNLKQELEFQENSNKKLQISLENYNILKEKEIGKVKEQLDLCEKEFKLAKAETIKEFKNELKELKESHQTEKEELKSQISTENLQRRSAEDMIFKLKSEYQSITSNLQAEITKMEVNLKIKEDRYEDLKEQESREEINLTVTRINRDLVNSKKEKDDLLSDYQVLESKYSDVVANLEITNSSILSVRKLVEQASDIIFNSLSGDVTEKMDFSSFEGAQNPCLENLIKALGKADSIRIQKIESLQAQNNELTRGTIKYEEDLQALSIQNALLETKNEENCEKLNSAQVQLSESNLKNIDLETENANLIKEKSKLEKAFDTAQENSKTSADDLSKKLLAEISSLKTQLNNFDSENSKLALELDIIKNGNESSLSEAREKWKDTLFAREAEFKNQLKQKEMIIKEKELLIMKFQQIGTPISSSKTFKTEASIVSPLKFKSVLQIEEMEDQTLIDIPMNESPEFVDDSPKTRKKARKNRNTMSAQVERDSKKLPPWKTSKPLKAKKELKKSGIGMKRSGSISSFPEVLDENSLFDLH